jgi:hypothetical protein
VIELEAIICVRMSSCIKCKSIIGRSNKEKISCKECKNYFHLQCVGLSVSELEFLSSRSWLCDVCLKMERLGRTDGTPVKSSAAGSEFATSEAVLNFSTVDKMLSELRDSILAQILGSQTKIESDLANFNKTCNQGLDSNRALIEQQNELIIRQQELLDQLKNENRLLHNKIADLANKLEESEQYSRRNVLEIYGVPERREEDVTKIVQDIGDSLGVKLDTGAIDCCHRLKKRINRPTSGIIVRFVRRSDAAGMLEARRKVGSLSSKKLGFQEDSPIFVNQSLTESRRKIFARARALKRSGGLKHLWIDPVGRIKARKVDGGQVFVLNSESDFEKF